MRTSGARPTRIRIVASTLLLLGATALAGRSAGEASTEDAARDPTAAPAADVASATSDEATYAVVPNPQRRVNVYWGWTIPDHPVQEERLAASARYVSPLTPATGAVTRLLRGPNAIETDIGMVTTIPAGTTLHGIALDRGTATVDLSAEFETSGGGLGEAMRLGQIVFTLTQFDNIDRVKFAIDGVPTDPILSHGFPVGDGLDRDDMEGALVRPFIMLESIRPGERVTNPLVVVGESVTFEGQVDYVLTIDGRIVLEGWTRGGVIDVERFEFSIDLDEVEGYRAGPASILLFEYSPDTGLPIAVVEYPIRLPAKCEGQVPTMLGTMGDDLITGSIGADVIAARAGDDVVVAGDGDDLVCLGSGDDRAEGNRGRDLLVGDDGDDALLGGARHDALLGGPGADVLEGGRGDDIADGDTGRDTIHGDDGDDWLLGGPQIDEIRGGLGHDELFAGNGEDVLRGGPGRDVLRGRDGDDHLYAGAGDDHLDGGPMFDECDGGTGVDTSTRCEVERRIP